MPRNDRPTFSANSADSEADSAASLSEASSYSRGALEKDLVDGFRKQQRLARERQVEHLVLAKGLGALAVASLADGCYNPRTVLPPLKPEEKKMFERMDFKEWRTGREAERRDAGARAAASPSPEPGRGETPSRGGSAQREGAGAVSGGRATQPVAASASAHSSPSVSMSASSSSCEELRENVPGAVKTFLKNLRSSARTTQSLQDTRAEVEDNIGMVEAALSNQSAPLSFATLLHAVSRALEVMERGSLTEDLLVPDCTAEMDAEASVPVHGPSAVPTAPVDGDTTAAVQGPAAEAVAGDVAMLLLHGAEEVEAYTRTVLLPKAYKAIAIAHSAEWMLQYTMAFLRTTEAINAEEAQTRLELLGRCVRLLGDTENFSSVLLSLEAKCEEYAGFTALKGTAEEHLVTLLDEVESSLDAVLSVPFPSRRSRLLLIERGVQKKLQRALLFLNEIDYSWTPTAHFHWAWKVQFLSRNFQRIHGAIARKYMRCSMGFIEDALYEKVIDTRITGIYVGASPVRPTVSRAQQVQYERVTEKLTLQQIGVSVKGVASLVVGEQVCMSARYIVRQSTKEFDEAWGFHMDEIHHAPSEDDVQKKVAKLAEKARRQFAVRQPKERTQPSTTFLTQNE